MDSGEASPRRDEKHDAFLSIAASEGPGSGHESCNRLRWHQLLNVTISNLQVNVGEE